MAQSIIHVKFPTKEEPHYCRCISCSQHQSNSCSHSRARVGPCPSTGRVTVYHCRSCSSISLCERFESTLQLVDK